MLRHKIYLFPIIMFGVTVSGGVIAAMSTTSADDISPIDDEITITVDSACTMGQTTLSSNPTLNPGETNTIGTSRIAAYCNDSNGYDIYVIGYTNGEYGNTAMQSADRDHTIPTGISGTDSYWNMRLAPGTATGTTAYIPTVENTFLINATIPDDYTKVASFTSTTIPQTEDPLTYGSYIDATYEAHISTTQPAGIYTGQVQYVMVHPSRAPAPEVPLYMQDTAKIKAKLTNVGDTAQVIDTRDGKSYWVAKLADGNIWMTQNLDLDIKAGRTYTSDDTDLAYSSIGTDWTPTQSQATYPTGATDWRSSYTAPVSYDPGDLYWDGTLDITWRGNLDNETVTDPSATPGGTHYHIGNYYNWTAAVAMSDSNSYTADLQDVDQSICPAGWRMPNLSENNSYQNLIDRQGLTAGTSGNIQLGPVYFVYSGTWNGASYYVGAYSVYWSSVVKNKNETYLMDFDSRGNLGPQANGHRSIGYSIRCVIR